VKIFDRVGTVLTGLFFVVIPLWWICWTISALWRREWFSAVIAQVVPWIANWLNTILRAYFVRDLTAWRREVRSSTISGYNLDNSASEPRYESAVDGEDDSNPLKET